MRTVFLSSVLGVAALLMGNAFASAQSSYSDLRSASPQGRAAEFLTTRNIVGGYPDGTFKPAQLLNRAEFLKIAMLSDATLRSQIDENGPCFNDVSANVWYAAYVCSAQNLGIVTGYPDDSFRPSQTVNYAEALAMLSRTHGLATDNDPVVWYRSYLSAANEAGVGLEIAPESLISRGSMARLAARFVAYSEGTLDAYIAAERGDGDLPSPSSSSAPSSSSSVSSSSASSSASSESSSTSSSSVSSTGLFTLPSRSHFLISGTTSDAVADGIIPSQSENRIVQAAKITLGQEMLSLSGIELTTVNGQRIAGLKRRVTANTDDYKKIYEFTLPSGNSGFVIPANETLHLIARAIIHDPEYGGASNQLLDIRSFSITTYGTASRTNFTTILPTPFPQHQTALGSISITTNAVSSAAAQGTGVALFSASVQGITASGRTVSLTSLTFSVDATNVSASHWGLRSGNNVYDCFTTSAFDVVCLDPSAPLIIPVGQSLMITLTADLSHGNQNAASIQVSLARGEGPSSPGGVRWTDGTTEFRWVEGGSVLTGPRLQ